MQRTLGQLLIFNLYVYNVSLRLFIDFTVNHTNTKPEICVPSSSCCVGFLSKQGGSFKSEGGSLYTSKRSTRILPKPDLRGFWGDSLTVNHNFRWLFLAGTGRYNLPDLVMPWQRLTAEVLHVTMEICEIKWRCICFFGFFWCFAVRFFLVQNTYQCIKCGNFLLNKENMHFLSVFLVRIYRF